MSESTGFRWFRRLTLLFLVALVALPLFVAISTSLKPLADIDDTFTWIPRHITTEPYADMWRTISLGRYLRSSLIVATTTTALALVVAVPAAYALARYRARGLRAFSLLLLATQAAPAMLSALPLYLIYSKIHDATGLQLIGSYPGLILADLTFALPVTIWLLTTYLAALPRDIEDAARVDGAGTLTVILRIVVPLAAPGIITAGLFAFLAAWGEVLFATLLTDNHTRTIPIGLNEYTTQSLVYWNQLTAAAITTSLPALIAFLAAQRILTRQLRMRRSG